MHQRGEPLWPDLPRGTGFPRLAIRKEGLVEGKHIGTTVHASPGRQNTAFYGLISNWLERSLIDIFNKSPMVGALQKDSWSWNRLPRDGRDEAPKSSAGKKGTWTAANWEHFFAPPVRAATCPLHVFGISTRWVLRLLHGSCAAKSSAKPHLGQS